MQQVGYVQKTKKRGLNFSFASESDLIEALRPAMVEAGLIVHPTGVRNVVSESMGKGYRVRGDFSYHFHHAPSDTGFDVEVEGEGADSWDKAANKAMTAAYKYCLRQSFMIETGDDPDKDSSDDQRRKAMGNGKRGSAPRRPAPQQPLKRAYDAAPRNGKGEPAPGMENAKGGAAPTPKVVIETSQKIAGLCDELAVDPEVVKQYLTKGRMYPLTPTNYAATLKEAESYICTLVKQQIHARIEEREGITAQDFGDELASMGIEKVTPQNMKEAWDHLMFWLSELEATAAEPVPFL